jgi:beta-mannanase
MLGGAAGRSLHADATQQYVHVWRRIATALTKKPALRRRTALVWDFTCDDRSALNESSFWPYYPGDEVVDWWAVNCFSGPLRVSATIPTHIP